MDGVDVLLIPSQQPSKAKLGVSPKSSASKRLMWKTPNLCAVNTDISAPSSNSPTYLHFQILRIEPVIEVRAQREVPRSAGSSTGIFNTVPRLLSEFSRRNSGVGLPCIHITYMDRLGSAYSPAIFMSMCPQV
jgi:hypothetical protein